MTHTFKIKETVKSKPLIEYLKTLSYVEYVQEPPRKTFNEAEMIAKVKKAEKGKKIPYTEFEKRTEAWKPLHLTIPYNKLTVTVKRTDKYKGSNNGGHK